MLPLSLLDWIALAVFGACWLGYANVVDRVKRIQAVSVIAAMDDHRRRWAHAMLARDNRIPDIAAIGNLMTSTGFLATTSIFILGGLVALLGASDMGLRVVAALPYAALPPEGGWALRIALLLVIFVNAFFELTWALRQFNYASILVGSLPIGVTPAAEAEADAAAAVLNQAARHFTTGLRSYYFGLAALAWILHPLALIAASLLVLRELHRREFHSQVREAVSRGG
jgi:uncharacterized membrane protein